MFPYLRFLISLLIPLSLHSQPVFSGRILTLEGAPIPRVSLILSGGSPVFRTDNDGRFRIPLTLPTYVLASGGKTAPRISPPHGGGVDGLGRWLPGQEESPAKWIFPIFPRQAVAQPDPSSLKKPGSVAGDGFTITLSHPDYLSLVLSIPANGTRDTAIKMGPLLNLENDVLDPSSPSGALASVERYWPYPVIPVCWEEEDIRFAMERRWVRDAIEASWAKETAISFVGWGACEPYLQAIRIRVQDTVPHVNGLGTDLLLGGRRMVLNFTFVSDFTPCAQTRESCIRFIARHEFGHALSFTHEHNRIDAPTECKAKSQGTNPEVTLTEYDSLSTMNYCAVSGPGLSSLDIQGARKVYGLPLPVSGSARTRVFPGPDLGGNAYHSFTGDAMGDGHAEILVCPMSPAGEAPKPQTIWLGRSQGDSLRFLSAGRWTASALARIYAADLNGDGKTDLLKLDLTDGASSFSPQNVLDAAISDGFGGFTYRRLLFPAPEILSVGDFDGNGRADILVTETSLWTVSTARLLSLTGSGLDTVDIRTAILPPFPGPGLFSRGPDAQGKMELWYAPTPFRSGSQYLQRYAYDPEQKGFQSTLIKVDGLPGNADIVIPKTPDLGSHFYFPADNGKETRIFAGMGAPGPVSLRDLGATEYFRKYQLAAQPVTGRFGRGGSASIVMFTRKYWPKEYSVNEVWMPAATGQGLGRAAAFVAPRTRDPGDPQKILVGDFLGDEREEIFWMGTAGATVVRFD